MTPHQGVRVASAPVLVLLALSCIASTVLGHCPNMCNGHGDCVGIAKCQCWSKWTGGDCSLRKCPTGQAWADVANAVDSAHQDVECSGAGTCDYETGTCKCYAGFEGRACNRMKCPNNCGGHGKCVSMRTHAATRSQGDGITVLTYDNVWDADMVYGCECDEGFYGYDCSLRVCPTGDDPMTKANQVNEVQLFKCMEDPNTAGTFTLTFRGETTHPIPYNADVYLVQARLNALPTLKGGPFVAFKGSALTVCDNVNPNPIRVEFTYDYGDLPYLLAIDPVTHLDPRPNFQFAYKGQTMDGFASVKGTREDIPCSGRGICDDGVGICECFQGYMTSDGQGAAGDRGDCGFAFEAITACPGVTGECSGHGVCSDHPEFKCTCADGWTGGDCSRRTCPQGRAWFDYPYMSVPPTIENDNAHNWAECSSKGVCNRDTGKCQCETGFEGSACERISCPMANGLPCSGNGKCLSMYQLAQLATSNGDATPFTYGATPNNKYTWDYNKLYGCFCDSEWQGFDCSKRVCPTGDDVTTEGQDHEMQVIQCSSSGVPSSGTFQLKFRQEITRSIAYNAPVATVKAELERLDSIGTVDVSYSAVPDEACTNGNVISVTFITELGDVPPMTVPAKTSDMTVNIYTDGQSASGVTSVKGTVENSECSERGLCNYETGQCECFVGFGSSNSRGASGDRGDCGYRLPIQSVPAGFSTPKSQLAGTEFDVVGP